MHRNSERQQRERKERRGMGKFAKQIFAYSLKLTAYSLTTLTTSLKLIKNLRSKF